MGEQDEHNNIKKYQQQHYMEQVQMNFLNEVNKMTPKTSNKNYWLGSVWLGRDESKQNHDIANYNNVRSHSK